METQFDVDGNDILFEMAQQIEQQLQKENKEVQEREKKQEQKNKDFQ